MRRNLAVPGWARAPAAYDVPSTSDRLTDTGLTAATQIGDKDPSKNNLITTGRAGAVQSRARPEKKPQEYSMYFEDFFEDVSRECARPHGRN